MVITSHKPVAMDTKGHFGELHMLALCCQSCLDVGHLTQKPVEEEKKVNVQHSL